jgi:hypothetical protein
MNAPRHVSGGGYACSGTEGTTRWSVQTFDTGSVSIEVSPAGLGDMRAEIKVPRQVGMDIASAIARCYAAAEDA